MAADPEEGRRDAAELERLQLENEKLKLEIDSLKSRLDRIAKLLPYGGFVIAVTGVFIGIWQYKEQQRLDREQRTTQSARQAEDARREFMKPLQEQLLKLSMEASSAAATLATTKNTNERANAVNTFWRLYQGPLIMVEDKQLSAAMVRFGHCLDGSEQCDKTTMESRARAIGSSGMLAVLNSYKSRPDDFLNDRFIYGKEQFDETQ